MGQSAYTFRRIATPPRPSQYDPFCGGTKTLGQLRAVLVNVPPLLGDLIRRALALRPGIPLTETGDLAAADVIILGPNAPPPPPGPVPVLKISPDLSRISGPGPADCLPFTPANLAARLTEIAARI